MRIIVTDLTRFKNENFVCIAGYNTETNECIRPYPYLGKDECRERNILPGAIIEGDFTSRTHCEAPHLEDQDWNTMTFDGPSSSFDFKAALECGLADSIEEGFESFLSEDGKYFPAQTPPSRSIITLNINPNNFTLVPNRFEHGKIRAHVTDNSLRMIRYLPVADLGFCEHAQRSENTEVWTNEVNAFLSTQNDLYIRIGVGRCWTDQRGRCGYWLQVNGIYTFPEFFEGIRCHVG